MGVKILIFLKLRKYGSKQVPFAIQFEKTCTYIHKNKN